MLLMHLLVIFPHVWLLFISDGSIPLVPFVSAKGTKEVGIIEISTFLMALLFPRGFNRKCFFKKKKNELGMVPTLARLCIDGVLQTSHLYPWPPEFGLLGKCYSIMRFQSDPKK